MLKFLRKKGVAKKVLWVVAIIIIISFGFMGTAYLITGQSPQSHAGKLFGKKISFDHFDHVYRQIRVQALIRFGNQFSEVEPYLDLVKETWDRMILIAEADKRKITAKDKEVVNAIEAYPFFQRDGQFDTLLYNQILRNAFRMKAREFEENVRESVRINKLIEQISTDLTVSDDEIFESFKKQNEKVQVSYVLIDPLKHIESHTFSDVEISQYYQTHSQDFLLPASINVSYVELRFPNIEEEQKDLIRQKADAIFQELLINPKLQEIATKFGVDVNSSGFFSQEAPNLNLGWPLPVLSSLLKMDENAIIDPFETTNGLFIAQVKEKRIAYTPSLEEAKPKVRRALAEEKARQNASVKAEEYKQQLLSTMSSSDQSTFSAAANALGLDVAQTPVFNRGLYLPKIGMDKSFQDAAFSLSAENSVSDVVDTPAGFCILHLDSITPASREEFEEQKDGFRQAVLDEKKNIAFSEFLTKLRDSAGLEDMVSKLKEEQTQ